MGGTSLQFVRNQDVVFSNSRTKVPFFCQEGKVSRRRSHVGGGLFASVNQVGKGIGVSPNASNSLENATNTKILAANMQMKFVSMPEPVLSVEKSDELVVGVVLEEGERGVKKKKKKKVGFKWKIKVRNQALRRLISGAVAGAVSRTVVAPLETIRTHLMVGSSYGHSTIEVFDNIMRSDGWQGLFRGNLVNVIRVAPSRAIEVSI